MARVLIVSFSVVPGSDRHGVQVLHALRALASRFVVDVLTVRMGDLAYVERFHKTRMLRVPVPDAPLGEQVEAFRRALRRQVEGAEYDVVHFRDGWSGLPIVQRARALGVRTVFDLGRSTLGEPRPADTKLAADLARDEEVCWKSADLVLTPTELGRRYLAARGRTDRVFVVPPGVDVDRFDWEPVDAGGPPRVVYAGALAAGRGVRVLLRAMRDVTQHLSARLVLVGPLDKGFRAPLEAAVQQLGLQGQVELLGAVENEDMPRVLSRATVCVAPAADDVGERPTSCFPTKLLEYMACRRPTIAPRRSSVSEVIEDGVDGLLFEAGNPTHLAAQILRLLADAPLRERIAEAAHHRVRQAYPASVTRRRLIEAYARLLPPAAWTPPSQAAPPILIAGADQERSPTGAHAVVADTDDLAGGPPTAITAPPKEALSDTDQVLVARPLDDTPPHSAGTDTEPWIVISADGSISKVSRKVPRELLATDHDGTPSDGVPGPPPLAVSSFRAGELDTSGAKDTPASADVTPSAGKGAPEPKDEIDPDDLSFVAAAPLLGSDVEPTKP